MPECPSRWSTVLNGNMGSRVGVEVPVTVMPSWYNRVYYHCRLGVIYQHMQDLDIQVVAIGLVCYIA